MILKTKNDTKGTDQSWEAHLTEHSTLKKSELFLSVKAWGLTEYDALKDLDQQLKELLPRLEKYLEAK